MKLKYGLLATGISEAIYETIRTHVDFDVLDQLDIDVNEIADRMAIKALGEIQNVLQNDKIPDFAIKEEIVKIFEKYDISVGLRHDF